MAGKQALLLLVLVVVAVVVVVVAGSGVEHKKKKNLTSILAKKSSSSSSASHHHNNVPIEELLQIPLSRPLRSIPELLAWNFNDPFNVATAPLRPRVPEFPKDDIRVMFCHDFLGGYVEDRFPQGGNNSVMYKFHNWQYVDSFIYFSHARIAIPPPVWTNSAHRNGVVMLGTLIVEAEDGRADLLQLLNGPCYNPREGALRMEDCSHAHLYPSGFSEGDPFLPFAEKLVDIAEYYGFDGWLMNFEVSVDGKHIPTMVKWLDHLTKTLNKRIPHSLNVWYDSILESGDLSWQGEVNARNKLFFDVTNAFFTDYRWSANMLPEMATFIGPERARDVYVGADVFGRSGSPSQFDTWRALKMIRDSKLSSAIFAPSYTYEPFRNSDVQGFDQYDFQENEDRFWVGPVHSPMWKRHLAQELLVSTEHLIRINSRAKSGEKVVGLGGGPIQLVPVEQLKKDADTLRGLLNDAAQWVYEAVETAQEDGKKAERDRVLDEIRNRITHQTGDGQQGLDEGLDDQNGGEDDDEDGSVLSAPTVKKEPEPLKGCIAEHVVPRPAPPQLPFVTSFDQGIGKRFFIDGKHVQEGDWGLFSQQDLLPTFLNIKVPGCGSDALDMSPSFSTAYNGGSSLLFDGEFESAGYTLFKLYRTHITVEEPLHLSYKYLLSRALQQPKLKHVVKPFVIILTLESAKNFVAVSSDGSGEPHALPADVQAAILREIGRAEVDGEESAAEHGEVIQEDAPPERNHGFEEILALPHASHARFSSPPPTPGSAPPADWVSVEKALDIETGDVITGIYVLAGTFGLEGAKFSTDGAGPNFAVYLGQLRIFENWRSSSVPGPVKDLAIATTSSNLGKLGVALTWTAPSGTKTPIRHYDVYLQHKGGAPLFEGRAFVPLYFLFVPCSPDLESIKVVAVDEMGNRLSVDKASSAKLPGCSSQQAVEPQAETAN